jgi:hypothetical protein
MSKTNKMNVIKKVKFMNNYDYTKHSNYYNEKYRYLSNEPSFMLLRYKKEQYAGLHLVCIKNCFNGEYFGHGTIDGATDENILISLFETKISTYENGEKEYEIIKPSNKKVLLKRTLEHRLISFQLDEQTGKITHQTI